MVIGGKYIDAKRKKCMGTKTAIESQNL